MHWPKAKTLHPTAESVETSYFGDRPKINLDFVDVSYSVLNRTSTKGTRQILQGVSGSFKFGELTVILGSSGAGKSTLLNILTGYVSANVKGSIRVNGHPCHTKFFRKLSSYVIQDDLIQPYLTVEESMVAAANLKLGKEFSKEGKNEVIRHILETLGLEGQRLTRTEKLSGGQKKRVSIALELINNPSIIFLDEPTTGLDVVSATQVIRLLQNLARKGRNIICTIHQPSAFLCQYFDHLYVMTNGCCVYQGSYHKLVPFMAHLGYDCPTTYNPADYIIEVIQGITKSEIKAISQEVENGKVSIEGVANETEDEGLLKVFRQQKLSSYSDSPKFKKPSPTAFSQQFLILLKRRFTQQSRNLPTLMILLFHHILSGVFLGTIFQGVGKDAGRPFENFKFLISVVVFFMYTNVLSPALLFPIEVKLMKREYFNGWYSLKAYFAALSVASIPYQVTFGIIFNLIVYLISNQPVDIFRFGLFTAVGLLLGYASEGWGLTIGSVFNCRNGSIVGPASIVPLLAVSVYGMGFGTVIEPVMKFLMSTSYLRYAVVGLTTSLYSHNRTIECNFERNMYCHYKNPTLLLRDLGMEESTTYEQIFALLLFLIFYRTTAYLGMKYRLNTEFSNKFLNYLTNLFRLQQKFN